MTKVDGCHLVCLPAGTTEGNLQEWEGPRWIKYRVPLLQGIARSINLRARVLGCAFEWPGVRHSGVLMTLGTAFPESWRWSKGVAIQDGGNTRASPVQLRFNGSKEEALGGSIPCWKGLACSYSVPDRFQVPPSPVWTLPPPHLLHPISPAAPNPPRAHKRL